MELSHLRVFLEVAEYLNFSKAAKKLHLSQPAVSIKIKSLEKFLKVELFERTQNRLELTKAGIETKASCKKIFEEISILEKCLSDAKIRLIEAQGYDEESWWYYIPFLNWFWDYLNK